MESLAILNTDFFDTIRNEVKDEIKSLKSHNDLNDYEPIELLTAKQAAKFLKISLPTLNKYSKNGKIPSYRLGKSIRYKSNDLVECLPQIKTRK